MSGLSFPDCAQLAWNCWAPGLLPSSKAGDLVHDRPGWPGLLCPAIAIPRKINKEWGLEGHTGQQGLVTTPLVLQGPLWAGYPNRAAASLLPSAWSRRGSGKHPWTCTLPLHVSVGRRTEGGWAVSVVKVKTERDRWLVGTGG